ncbi:DUF3426 domain-containing protein [Xanthomonas sp. WHRI 6106]|uniref:DUF3426 domain-containing protein n=1 Tax=Xanthomonas sp. WHRI 6106 TaxID=3161566 RepID=UPI0032E8B234
MSQTPPPRRPLATFLRATPPAAPTLIPTPTVPAAEPPEQVLPVPAPALPPAPAQPVVPPPPAPVISAPAAPVTGLPANQPSRAPAAPHEPSSARADAEPDHVAGTPGMHGAADAAAAAADRPDARARDADLPRPPAAEADPTAQAAMATGDAGDPASPASPFHPLPAVAAPTFARRGFARPRLRASGRQWAVLIGLVALLGLQIVVADRAQLAGNARWRPLVSVACTLARCTLPAWREPAALTLLTRDVRPLPGAAGVLQVQASFRNDARWAQAWPWLQLSLSDADGRVIGTRVLTPQEYLGKAPAAQDTLAPGQAVQVAFAVREPAASTAAFSFDFR